MTLRALVLEQFRSFSETTSLEFAPLTLLAGPNNVGKSSVVQAILALLQSEQGQSQDEIVLNGPWCELGLFEQVVSANRHIDERNFAIGITGDRDGAPVDTLWRFGASEDPSLPSARIVEVEYSVGAVQGKLTVAEGKAFTWSETGDGSEPRTGTASFRHPGALSVNEEPASERRRLAPQTDTREISPLVAARTYHVGPYRSPPQALYTPRTTQQGSPLGRYAEHTAEILYRSRGHVPDILAPTAPPTSQKQPLLFAVNAWWSYLFEGAIALSIDAPARLGFTLAIETPSAAHLGLGQVGLGLSQALPIITAALVSRPGDLVIIETPEAHLHPGAQHRIGNLLVALARHGRQVIVETHSEHLVNAVRLAIKGGFPAKDTSVVFFGQDEGRTTVEPIDLDPHGRALRWPPGFFDQATLDLAELLR